MHEGEYELDATLVISKSLTICNVGDVSVFFQSQQNDRPLIWLEQPKGIPQDDDIQVVLR